MSSSRTTSKASLFLMELIIAIAFFAMASAICIQFFAKAHTLSTKSNDTNMAVSIAQNTAETFKYSNADLEQIGTYLGFPLAEGSNSVYYDSDWRPLPDAQGSRYLMTLAFSEEAGLAQAVISICDLHSRDVPLHELTAVKYVA